MPAFERLSFADHLAALPFGLRELAKRKLVTAYSSLDGYPYANKIEFKELSSVGGKIKSMQMGLYEPFHVYPTLVKDETEGKALYMRPNPTMSMDETIAMIADPSSVKFSHPHMSYDKRLYKDLTAVERVIVSGLKDVDLPLCVYADAALDENKDPASSMTFAECTTVTMGTSPYAVMYANTYVRVIPAISEERAMYKYENELVYKPKFKAFFCAAFTPSSPTSPADLCLAEGVDMIKDMAACMNLIRVLMTDTSNDSSRFKNEAKRWYLYWRGFEVRIESKKFDKIVHALEAMRTHVDTPAHLVLAKTVGGIKYTVAVIYEAMGMLKRDAMDVVAAKTSGAIKDLIPFADMDRLKNPCKIMTTFKHMASDTYKIGLKAMAKDKYANPATAVVKSVFRDENMTRISYAHKADTMSLDALESMIEANSEYEPEAVCVAYSADPHMNRHKAEYVARGVHEFQATSMAMNTDTDASETETTLDSEDMATPLAPHMHEVQFESESAQSSKATSTSKTESTATSTTSDTSSDENESTDQSAYTNKSEDETMDADESTEYTMGKIPSKLTASIECESVAVASVSYPAMFMTSTEFQYASMNPGPYASKIVSMDEKTLKMLDADEFMDPIEYDNAVKILAETWNVDEPCTSLSVLANCQPFITYNQPPRPTLGVQTMRQTLDLGWIKTDTYFKSKFERRPMLSTSTVFKSEALSCANTGPLCLVVFAMDVNNATYESGLSIGEWILHEFEYMQVVQSFATSDMPAFDEGTDAAEIEGWRPTTQTSAYVAGFEVKDEHRIMYVAEDRRYPELQDKFVLNHGTKGTLNRIIRHKDRIAVKCVISGEILVADVVMEPVTTRNAYGPLIEGSFNYHALAKNVYDSARLDDHEVFYKGEDKNVPNLKAVFESEGMIIDTDLARIKDKYKLKAMLEANTANEDETTFLDPDECKEPATIQDVIRSSGTIRRKYLTPHGMDTYAKANPKDLVLLEGMLMVWDPNEDKFVSVTLDGHPVMANYGLLNVNQVGHMSGTNQQYFDKCTIRSINLPRGRLAGGTTRMGIDDMAVLISNGFKDHIEHACLSGDGIVTEVCTKCKHYAAFCDCNPDEDKTKAWTKILTRYSLMRMDMIATMASINSSNGAESTVPFSHPTTRKFVLP